MRLTSVFSLAAHFVVLVFVVTAGTLHLLLHLFQLIQVNPANQLEVPADLKKAQADDGTMNQTARDLSGGRSFQQNFPLGLCVCIRDQTNKEPERSFSSP